MSSLPVVLLAKSPLPAYFRAVRIHGVLFVPFPCYFYGQTNKQTRGETDTSKEIAKHWHIEGCLSPIIWNYLKQSFLYIFLLILSTLRKFEWQFIFLWSGWGRVIFLKTFMKTLVRKKYVIFEENQIYVSSQGGSKRGRRRFARG